MMLKRILLKIFLSRWLFWLAIALLLYGLLGLIYETWFSKSSSPGEELTALALSITYILGRHEGMRGGAGGGERGAERAEGAYG